MMSRTFIASFLGWTLDAFDFFLLAFVVPRVASDFHRPIFDVAFAITLTLMCRPLGALIFGWMGDRFGRRTPLMIDVACFSVIELATAFSPNFVVFLVLRALYGVAMGGEWGLGAALAMESLPAQKRGLFSGLLQEGYSVGFLLAAIVFGLFFSAIGWRGMFAIGVLPALLIFYIRKHVPESPTWIAAQSRVREKREPIRFGAVMRYAPLFIYTVLLMAAFNFMSHGTQDLYPTFLQVQRHLSVHTVAWLAIVYNIGAIAGGIVFGGLSQRIGRRTGILIATALGIVTIPLWIHAPTIALLAFGGFLLQFMVQGAWGIVPAHLNELSPGGARGTFPGFTYQLGNLISAPAAQLEATIAKTHFATASGAPDYAAALSAIALVVFIAVFFLTGLGYLVAPERRTQAF
jgi:MFS transporter, SHS family, lactate transporter